MFVLLPAAATMRWPNSVIVAIGVKFSPGAVPQSDGRHDGIDEAVESDDRAARADVSCERAVS